MAVMQQLVLSCRRAFRFRPPPVNIRGRAIPWPFATAGFEMACLWTRTVRSMLGLAHYRFRQKLEWMCRKRLIFANEAYTSKTRSWDGVVSERLGGAKTVSDGSIVVDRDVNGARGIMLRALYGNLGRFRATGDDVALVAE